MIKTRKTEESDNEQKLKFIKTKRTKKGESLEQTGISEGFENQKKNEDLSRANRPESRNNTPTKENQRQNIFLEQKRRRENPKVKKRKSYDIKERKSEENKKQNINIITLEESDEDEPEEKEEKKTLFIKSNYYYLTTEDIKELRNIFKKYGALKTINISSKGFGFVEFYDKNSASTAINNKDKILFKQKKLRIEYAKYKIIKDIYPKPKGKNKQKRKKKEIDIQQLTKKNAKKRKENDIKKNINQGTNNNSKDNSRIEELESKFNKLEKEIQDLKISIRVLTEINNQSEIYMNANINYLKKKLRLIINAYKILYMRKLANLILDQLYNKYRDYLEKFKVQVGNNNKYNFIAVKSDIKAVNDIDSIQINLIIDFLRYIWDKGSTIIHINDKNIKIQKEILYFYLGYSEKTIDEKIKTGEMVEIQEIVGLIFENKEEKKSKNNKKIEKDNNLDNNLINQIKNMIKEENSNKPKNKSSKKKVFQINDENIISLSDSEDFIEQNNQIIEEKLKSIIGGELIKIDLSSQMKMLIKKIKINQEIKEIIEDNVEDINGEFLYNLWKQTFFDDKCKLKKLFTKYNNKESISTLQEMGFYLCELLGGTKIDIFIEDPKNIDKNIPRHKNQNNNENN